MVGEFDNWPSAIASGIRRFPGDDFQRASSSASQFHKDLGRFGEIARLATSPLYDFAALFAAEQTVMRELKHQALKPASHAMQDILQSPMEQAVRASQRFDKLIDELNPQMRALDAVFAPDVALPQGFDALRLAASSLLDQYQCVEPPASVRVLMAAWDQASRIAEIEAYAPDADNASAVGRPRLSRGDAIALASVLLTILLAIYQDLSATRMEARLQNSIDASDAARVAMALELHAVLEDLTARTVLSRPYVTRERPAKVREEPTSGSPITGELAPNQMVVATALRGKWIRVEFVDPKTAALAEGWALKKYFAPVASRGVARRRSEHTH